LIFFGCVWLFLVVLVVLVVFGCFWLFLVFWGFLCLCLLSRPVFDFILFRLTRLPAASVFLRVSLSFFALPMHYGTSPSFPLPARPLPSLSHPLTPSLPRTLFPSLPSLPSGNVKQEKAPVIALDDALTMDEKDDTETYLRFLQQQFMGMRCHRPTAPTIPTRIRVTSFVDIIRSHHPFTHTHIISSVTAMHLQSHHTHTHPCHIIRLRHLFSSTYQFTHVPTLR
jgi:hypothetical protein